jgi:putative PIN family toxin of toxin-antitoxin system
VKVVFDTNVFVSALTLPGGRGDQALGKIIESKDSLAISRPIIDELLSVLARKFGRDREELARVAISLSNLVELVEPLKPLAILSDEPDNRILECALAAQAQVIVTGDRAMLALGEFQGIRIVSLGEYLG